MTNRYVLRLIFALQFVCALFFISDIVISVLGLRMRPIDWQFRELLEIGAAVGLSLGTVLGAVALFRSQAKTNRIEGQLRAASGAFAELLDENFDQWALTPAERDVAWFAIKGMSTQEIAALRSTSEGTVKAQSNAIYRKRSPRPIDVFSLGRLTLFGMVRLCARQGVPGELISEGVATA